MQKTPLDFILSARCPAVPREASLSADRVVRSEEENGAGPALPWLRTLDGTEGTGLARVCTARPRPGPRMKSSPPHQGSAPGPLPFCTLPWGWGSSICACTREAMPTGGLGEPSWLEEGVPLRLLPTAASAPHPLGAVWSMHSTCSQFAAFPTFMEPTSRPTLSSALVGLQTPHCQALPS